MEDATKTSSRAAARGLPPAAHDDDPFGYLDAPTPEFRAEMRSRYPTELETERMLDRKLERRSRPPFTPHQLGDLANSVHRFAEAKLGLECSVTNARWATGGASKIQMAFDLTWKEQTGATCRERLLLRMDPAESHNATSKLREFELLRAFEGTVPVPRVFWVDDAGEWLPEPALIYSFVDGVTKPRAATSGAASGLGTQFGPDLRMKLAPQFVEYLAKIHTFDYASVEIATLDHPRPGTNEAAFWQLNRARRVWEEDRGDDYPLMEVAAAWLEANAPPTDVVSVVHGDYRSGNFLYDEATGKMTAWLDWERAHLGDRHRDLAWSTQSVFGHYTEDGDTYLVCGLMPMDEFFSEYERLSGLNIDPERLRYYQVLNAYQLLASTLGTIYRVVRLGKTHQDVLLARFEGTVPLHAAALRALLLEVL